ncbi:7-cyano-7-deazaguanine synthase [Bradyrhizobium sp. AS23.2]|uniref:7-cyano-7-deazaguanine synthase n=1 Tax=Bradyrhizobium sp. AS23.2 TaxID=1680155 RepID=UPI00094063CF|nr:7-cyano-7-deazaguanine synthase [Bradyrhizobium sp. AS23.2]OKO67466.1 ExsB family transcriptional regulator [Bradyrhizobium sp. AS23.2]
MSTVTLVSGGLDSTLMARLAQEISLQQHPLFIDYGQRARDAELAACRQAMTQLGLPEPRVAELAGFGELIRSGLTDRSKRTVEDAFTPGRNLLFLLIGAAYAVQVGATAVSIGLLHEETSLFPDQTKAFLSTAEAALKVAMGRPFRVLAPLADFHKSEVVELAKVKGIFGTYSCHVGEEQPCGQCIACREFQFEGDTNGRG